MDITIKKVSRSIPLYLLLWYIVLFALPLCASWELKPIVVGAETFTEFDKHLGKNLVFAECDGRLAVIDNANNRILLYALNGSIQNLTFLADFGTFAQPNPIVPYVPFNPTTNNRVDSNVHGAFFRDTLWVRNRLEGGANAGSDILRFTKNGEFIDRIGNPAGVRYLYESGERLFGVDGQKIWQWDPESSAFEQVFTVPSNSGVSFSDSNFAIRKGYTTLQVFRW